MRLSLGRYDELVRTRAASVAPELERVWKRDASFWGGDEARRASVANRLGWLSIVEMMRGRVHELDAFRTDAEAAGFRDAVVLGMGGSSLAPEVMRQGITDDLAGSAIRLHILDTTDPATISSLVERIDVSRTIFFVSSKSGTTIEALSLYAYFRALVTDRIGATGSGDCFVAITDEGTPLQALAKAEGFRRVFVNPADIGGRYSALSYFGLVPAVVAGLDVRVLLASAAEAVEAFQQRPEEAALLGCALAILASEGRDTCTFLLAPGISAFGLWVEQLIAESTGKEGKGVLPVAGEPILDPARYGDDRFFVQMRLGEGDNAVLDAHVAALEAAGHPVISLDLRDSFDLGGEFFRWEFAVALAGRELGINPFDEPNVQESKDNTSRALARFEADGEIPIDSVDAGAALVPERLKQFGAAIEMAGYFAITSFAQPTDVSDDVFAEIRRAVSDRYGVATTLGYGPRFLHSTGQFHKGGPPVGVFLQVLDESDTAAGDLMIPGQEFTFGQLKRAQAAGDRESLVKLGRTVLTVGVSDEGGLLDLRAAFVRSLGTTTR